jgi:ketosteroid isomerase-like protein
MTNQDIVNKFFDSYMKRDLEGVKNVMAADVVWYFMGRHKLAGTKNGIDEVIKFFDTMGGVMAKSRPTIEKLIVAESENYLIECQYIRTNRADGINIEHYVSVLWTIEDGKIISGRHFFADPESVDRYFNAVPIH